MRGQRPQGGQRLVDQLADRSPQVLRGGVDAPQPKPERDPRLIRRIGPEFLERPEGEREQMACGGDLNSMVQKR
ncbi:hypothetical protein GCM10027614_41530 [Micromonospora vulcania]